MSTRRPRACWKSTVWLRSTPSPANTTWWLCCACSATRTWPKSSPNVRCGFPPSHAPTPSWPSSATPAPTCNRPGISGWSSPPAVIASTSGSRRPRPARLKWVTQQDSDDDDGNKQDGDPDQKDSVASSQAKIHALPSRHLLSELFALALLAFDTLFAAFLRANSRILTVWTGPYLLHAAAHGAVVTLRLLLLGIIGVGDDFGLRRLRAGDGGPADGRPVAFAALLAPARLPCRRCSTGQGRGSGGLYGWLLHSFAFGPDGRGLALRAGCLPHIVATLRLRRASLVCFCHNDFLFP